MSGKSGQQRASTALLNSANCRLEKDFWRKNILGNLTNNSEFLSDEHKYKYNIIYKYNFNLFSDKR